MTKKELLQKLDGLGVTNVDVEYDGSGDSGSVESVTATGRGLGATAEITLPEELRQACDDAAVECLEEKGIDWYNNDGGFGHFYIDVVAKTCKLEHEERVNETNSDYYDDEPLVDDEQDEVKTAPVAPPVAECTCLSLLHGHHHNCPYILAKKS